MTAAKEERETSRNGAGGPRGQRSDGSNAAAAAASLLSSEQHAMAESPPSETLWAWQKKRLKRSSCHDRRVT